ncbi:MAG: glutamine-hydrolyzing carbamoyl-phosphate synthase small subunit [Candidatus Altimarinota bacterium]
MKASLILKDGTTFRGESFGYEGNTSGEVVFNTGMIGYPETLTDPSYKGQILVTTYPLIGNYGIPDFEIRDSFGIKTHFESERIHLCGLIVSEYSENYNHFESNESLAHFLKRQKIPAISGIDTRALTEYIRENGCTPGKIIIEGKDDTEDFIDPNERLLAYEVATKEVTTYKALENRKNKNLLIVDMGVKNNMLRHFLKLGVDIIRVPGNYPFMDGSIDFDAIFLSNGPGDPAKYRETIEETQKAIRADKKIFGICLGNQLLALAGGGKTYKLPYGHRGQNQPIKDLETGKCILTSQNHSFAIDESTLPANIIPWMKNINDGTNEGIRFKDKTISSVQFHPESSPGPHDSTYLFHDFIEKI